MMADTNIAQNRRVIESQIDVFERHAGCVHVKPKFQAVFKKTVGRTGRRQPRFAESPSIFAVIARPAVVLVQDADAVHEDATTDLRNTKTFGVLRTADGFVRFSGQLCLDSLNFGEEMMLGEIIRRAVAARVFLRIPLRSILLPQ